MCMFESHPALQPAKFLVATLQTSRESRFAYDTTRLLRGALSSARA
jgi:hypothetical protein